MVGRFFLIIIFISWFFIFTITVTPNPYPRSVAFYVLLLIFFAFLLLGTVSSCKTDPWCKTVTRAKFTLCANSSSSKSLFMKNWPFVQICLIEVLSPRAILSACNFDLLQWNKTLYYFITLIILFLQTLHKGQITWRQFCTKSTLQELQFCTEGFSCTRIKKRKNKNKS